MKIALHSMSLSLLLAFLLHFTPHASVCALDNGVGRVPAMGWNSWNRFRCDIDEQMVKDIADVMVTSGLRDAGYKYVNIDDCWQERRDEAGNIVPNYTKFPSGMKALADYVHERGLLFGLYSDTGNITCEGYPGSWGHEQQDANSYASWGVDYLKYDFCGMESSTEPVEESYARMSRALNATGRPILFSLCSWGNGHPWNWGHKVGNSWRTDADLFAVWDAQTAQRLKLPFVLKPFTRALEVVEKLSDFAGPGGFNDPDMLVVGLDGMTPFGIVQDCPDHIPDCKPGSYISRERWGMVGGLTFTEQKTHFALWCMLASPLMLGNDPRTMTKATHSILTAPEILAISQDPLGKQAKKMYKEGQVSIWVKPLADGRVAVALFNEGSEPMDISTVFSRDMPEQASRWARNIPPPDCADKSPMCRRWAQEGACENNSPLMWDQCRTSCPAACPKDPLPPGPKATAIVRDAWQEDDLGPATGLYNAHLVEPHEARILTLKFVEPEEAKKWVPTMVQTLTSGKLRFSRRSTSDPKAITGTADELKYQVSQLSVHLQNANAQLSNLAAKLQETEMVAEQLQLGPTAQGERHELLSEATPQHQGGLPGNAWDEARMGAAVWSTWPGQLLVACNLGVLLVLLISQFKRPKSVKPGSHSE